MNSDQIHNAEKQSEDSWIDFDKFKLDEECERQAKLKLTYGELLARQRREAAVKKNKLKVIMAEVDKEVRADPASFGITKISEKAFENAVLLDGRVQALIAEHIEAEFWVGIAEAEVYALNDRKSMLEKEVDLYLSGYFAAPKVGKKNWERKRDQETDEAFQNPSKKERE